MTYEKVLSHALDQVGKYAHRQEFIDYIEKYGATAGLDPDLTAKTARRVWAVWAEQPLPVMQSEEMKDIVVKVREKKADRP